MSSVQSSSITGNEDSKKQNYNKCKKLCTVKNRIAIGVVATFFVFCVFLFVIDFMSTPKKYQHKNLNRIFESIFDYIKAKVYLTNPNPIDPIPEEQKSQLRNETDFEDEIGRLEIQEGEFRRENSETESDSILFRTFWDRSE